MSTNKIQNLIENVLNLLDLDKDQYTVTQDSDSEVNIQINLPDDETGLFIGHHGETITSLQLLLSLMISQRLGTWYRVGLNVNDYQQKREDSLKNLAESAAQKAIELNQEVVIPNLSSYERRIIHLCLEENPQVTTESKGEAPNRQLIVTPKR